MPSWHYRSALITGASAGLGRDFALLLAQRGCDLVLVARREEKLAAVAAGVEALGRKATVLRADLESAEQRARLRSVISEHNVDLLVNNAGFGKIGRFEELSIADIAGQIAVNCLAQAELSRYAVEHFCGSGIQGGILNIGSLASSIPIPYFAVYTATKAFVRTFTESLGAEMESRGLRVAVALPGATDTEFFHRAGEEGAELQRLMPSRKCAEKTLDQFGRGKRVIVPGVGNRLLQLILERTPKALLQPLTNRVFQRKFGK